MLAQYLKGIMQFRFSTNFNIGYTNEKTNYYLSSSNISGFIYS